MRVLLRDAEDSTYILVDAEHLCYDVAEQELYVASANFEYTVQKIVRANADSIMRELMEKGMADLTQFGAVSTE